MKIISWNVNGIRAVRRKDFESSVESLNPDVLCLQETKISDDMLTNEIRNIPGYESHFFSAKKKGYSGTAIFSKQSPLSIKRGLGIEEFDSEGRVLTAEFDNFYVISVYVVNVQPGLPRLSMRERFNDALLAFANSLDKPAIICGDFNVAHKAIDVKNDKANLGKPGCTIEERAKFDELLASDYIDTFRHFYPNTVKYSWWSYRGNARANNTGWRLDYIVVPKSFIASVADAFICNNIHGSDHCPVGIILT